MANTEVKATAKYLRIAPRKARMVVDMIRNKSVAQALEILQFSNRAAAVVWTTLWAALLFRETITLKNLLGIGILFAGIWMVNRDG